MARVPNLDKYSYAELVELRDEMSLLIEQKKAEAKLLLKQKLTDLAKEQGFDVDEVMGKKRSRGIVPVKYRDPDNPSNTWTGRGHMPRWLAAATKKRGITKEDFLI